ncbi:MAG: membrane-bound lytic murein transglycosylase F [Flavobacteriales bacterium]|jgi:membrane-bound lytic murein transglycosylase F
MPLLRLLRLLLILVISFGLFSCDKEAAGPIGSATNETLSSEQQHTEDAAQASVEVLVETAVEVYKSLGDLTDIQSHKVLRLISTRIDLDSALPRSGISKSHYRIMAEDFAKQQGLAVEWVYVDDFSQLIPTLNEGLGDIIISNISVTKERKKNVSFSKALNQVSEVLITHKSEAYSNITNADDINSLSELDMHLAEGTVFFETLKELEFPNTITVSPTGSTVHSILSTIDKMPNAATILDSDEADDYLDLFPNLTRSVTLKKNRKVAWALRKNNPALLKTLNEFLIAHHIQESNKELVKRDWHDIKSSGRLRMLSLNNPASYFMWRGELMGFDYELLKKFADDEDVILSVIVKDSIPELIQALQSGEGDVIAASLTKTPAREVQGIRFSRPYLKVDELIVARKDHPQITEAAQLAGSKVAVNPATTFYTKLIALKHSGIDFEIVEFPDASTEELIENLQGQEYDYTVADSHLLKIEESYHQNVTAQFALTTDSNIAWGLRGDQILLNKKLDAFIKKRYRGLFYNMTFNKYFKSTRKIQRYQKARLQKGDDLSPFDGIVSRQAKPYNMDWRFIIAQMYQESKFKPDAKSFAGALGLMQVMPRTANEFGYSDLHEPNTGIAAGLAYLHWLEKRFPGDLDFQERIYFILAAYNAGTGHVRDARKLAKKLDLNPDVWFDNVEVAMLKLAKKEYYQHARFGYVRGREPVNYVRMIRDRYLAYLEAQ